MTASVKVCNRCGQKDITDFSSCRFCGVKYSISDVNSGPNRAVLKSTDWKVLLIFCFWIIPVIWQFCGTRPYLNSASSTAVIQSVETAASSYRTYRGYRRRGSLIDMVTVGYNYTTPNGATYDGKVSSPFLPIQSLPPAMFGLTEGKPITVYYSPANPQHGYSPQIGEAFTWLLLIEYGVSIFLVGLLISVFEGLNALIPSAESRLTKGWASVAISGALFVVLFVVPVVFQTFVHSN